MFGPVNNKTCSALLICLLLLAAMFARNALNPQLVSAGSPTFAVQAFDADGNYLPNVVPNVTPDSSGDLFISFPKHSQFRPGLYYVRVYVVRGGIVYVSDSSFRWGVVALNFDKTVYSPTDQVNIGFGVLDDAGRTVCSSDAQLSITGPGGVQVVYTTENGSIQKSALCGPNTIISTPDYSVQFSPGTVGDYQVTLTANTHSGIRTVSDQFEVRGDEPFDVMRDAPTRIYPPSRYKVSMRVTPRDDFSGVITEIVPASFAVSQVGLGESEAPLAVTSSTDPENLTLIWHASLTAGKPQMFWYVFKAPDISPEFYLTGPLTFTPDDLAKPQWAETRQWQIAADACGFGTLLASNQCQGAITDTASTTWTVPSDWTNSSNTIEVVGGGGGGANGGANGTETPSGGGGGGGAYAKISNFSTSTGAVIKIQVGPGGAAVASGTLTYFNWNGSGSTSTCTANTMSLCAASGGRAASSTAGSGGSTALSVATSTFGVGTSTKAGGNGGTGYTGATTGAGGAGGGGAGGPNGVGPEGGNASAATPPTGGSGGGGNGGGVAGGVATSTGGAAGGSNFSGNGGGASSTTENAGQNGGGGSGGAGAAGTPSIGGNGSMGLEWSGASPAAGTGGAPGGGGGDTKTTGLGSSNPGGNAGAAVANTGAGGGGGGNCRDSGCTGGAGTAGASGVIVITYTPAYASTTESRYRWRNDDGSESGASWQVAQNTAGTATSTGNVYRIRFEAANSGNITSTKNFKLEYQASATSGAWTAMPSTSTLTTELFVMTTSTQATLPDGTSTTAQLTADATRFVAGTVKESTSSSGNISLNSELATTTFTEVEYVIKIATSTTNSSNGTYFFRMTDAGTALDSYTQWAQLTLSLPVPPNRPILNLPAPGVTTTLSGIVFKQTGTSPNAQNLQYQNIIYQNEACTQVVETHDQSGSQTGWTGQDASSSAEYTSGNTGIFTTTSTLTASTTYYWGASAKDPEGSNSFGAGGTTAVAPTWAANANAIPTALQLDSAAVYNGYIYIVGGENGSNIAQSSTYFASIQSNGTVGPWATTTALPNPLFNLSAVAYNGYLYSTGGGTSTNGVPTTSVFQASINSNGSLNAWSLASNTLPSPLALHSAVAYNGYIYTTGGCSLDTGCSVNKTSTVFYAPINADGSIGSFANASALPSAFTRHSAVAYNGYIYTTGGLLLGQTSVYRATINSTGSLSSWTNTTALPSAVSQHSAAAYNGYLYVVGGTTAGNVPTTTVSYAPLNSNGAVGTWAQTTVLPHKTTDAPAVVSNGYLYQLGGNDNSGLTSTIFYAQINQQGSTDSANGWKNLNALPSAVESHSAVAYNGYLYITGGCNASCVNLTSTVFYAPINASGTVGAWTTNVNSLPSAIRSHSAVAYNGYLYTTGGFYTASAPTTSVFYAKINSTGSVGIWQTNSTTLPSAIGSHSAVVYNGYIYTTGGIFSGSTATSSVFYAPINANGTVGTFATTTALPSAIDSHSTVVYNGYIYTTGGTGGAISFYAPINANGTVGTFATTTALPSTIQHHSAVVYNGYIYTTGGSGVTSSVFYAQILPLAVGSGTISSWLTATALPSAINFHSAVVYNGYIYNTGGSTDAGVTVTSTVQSIGLYTSCTAFTPVNSAPTVSAVSLNHNNTITLIGNATTSFDINYTISDADGCGDIKDGVVTSTAFRTGVQTTCAMNSPTASNQSCYISVTNVTSSCSGTSIKGTSTVLMWYFANSTGVASSSFSNQHWEAYVSAHDALGATSTATSSDVDVNVLTAINIATTTINYNTLVQGQNTSSTNQQEIIQNVGNSSSTLQVSGNAFTSGANSIATSSQHYATSTFTFGGAEQVLSSTALDISGLTMGTDIDLSRFTQGWVTNANALPSAISLHSAVTYNGYIYTTGGDTAIGATSSIFQASINADGSLNPWSLASSSLPTKRREHGAVAYNGQLYVIGGYVGSVTSSVFQTSINSNGSLNAWSLASSSLPSSLIDLAAVTYNGKLYALGGSISSGGAGTSSVFQASINADGSLNAWSLASSSLPSGLMNVAAVAYNGYLYTIGGTTSTAVSSIGTSSVFQASINADGSLNAWSLASSSLPSGLENLAAVTYNGYLYVLGGATSTPTSPGSTSTVFYAPVLANGSVGTWVTATALPSGISKHSAVMSNGYLYTTGGEDSAANATSTVFYTPLDARPTYWGVSVPSNAAAGSYQSTVTYVAVFSS